jgi:hypothetical protein
MVVRANLHITEKPIEKDRRIFTGTLDQIKEDYRRNLVDIANVFVLALTLAAIVWYSFETRWLRQETEKNNAGSIRPIMIVEFTNDRLANDSPFPTIRNIGFGPAFNVEIESITNGEYEARFPRFLLIPNQSSQALQAKTYRNGEYHNVFSPSPDAVLRCVDARGRS